MAADEREYRVRWEIDVSASSEREAAGQARAIQVEHDSIANVFDVAPHDDPRAGFTRIDISND